MADSLARIPIIDVDTHWAEPRDFWTSRAPAKFRDVAPRVERSDEGIDQWVVEDDLVLGPVGYCVIQRDGGKVLGKLAVDTFDEMHPSASQPKQRLQMMDAFSRTCHRAKLEPLRISLKIVPTAGNADGGIVKK